MSAIAVAHGNPVDWHQIEVTSTSLGVIVAQVTTKALLMTV